MYTKITQTLTSYSPLWGFASHEFEHVQRDSGTTGSHQRSQCARECMCTSALQRCPIFSWHFKWNLKPIIATIICLTCICVLMPTILTQHTDPISTQQCTNNPWNTSWHVPGHSLPHCRTITDS